MGDDGIYKELKGLAQFYVSSQILDSPFNEIKIKGPEARHITGSRRLGPGQKIRLADGSGKVRTGIITEAGKRTVCVKMDEGFYFRDDSVDMTMLLSITKAERFDFSIAKLSEIGIKTIQPVIASRSPVSHTDKERMAKKHLRWKKISIECLKQSRGFKATEIEIPKTLKEALRQWQHHNFSVRMCLDESEQKKEIGQLNFASVNSVIVAVGPEGGFSSEEMELMKESGFQSVGLGPRILRSETAAIFIGSIVSGALRAKTGR